MICIGSLLRKKPPAKLFDTAYECECRAISAKLKQMIADDSDPHAMSGVSTIAFPSSGVRWILLIEVFARLLNESWLDEVDLSGLN